MGDALQTVAGGETVLARAVAVARANGDAGRADLPRFSHRHVDPDIHRHLTRIFGLIGIIDAHDECYSAVFATVSKTAESSSASSE